MSDGTLHSAGDVVGGRYKITGYIGAGGMQEVYRADDSLLSKPVALKSPKNTSAEKRFKRSAVVSARVNHVNVAKTLDYIEEGERPYLIEELIEGVDLSEVLKKYFAYLDPYQAAMILHRLARGLAASHHAGVVHRDLKPSNVMALGAGHLLGVKITDFGIAKMAEEELAEAIEGGDESLTASQTAIGALPYMSPEMINSIKNAGMPTDIWSLGAMLFELISGTKPFGSGLRSVPRILAGVVPPLPAFCGTKPQFRAACEELYAIVLECMRVDPAARPSADQLVEKCERLCYALVDLKFGAVNSIKYKAWGFISSDVDESVFFHLDSLYSAESVKVGDRVAFAKHQGGGADRAFPVLKLRA